MEGEAPWASPFEAPTQKARTPRQAAAWGRNLLAPLLSPRGGQGGQGGQAGESPRPLHSIREKERSAWATGVKPLHRLRRVSDLAGQLQVPFWGGGAGARRTQS